MSFPHFHTSADSTHTVTIHHPHHGHSRFPSASGFPWRIAAWRFTNSSSSISSLELLVSSYRHHLSPKSITIIYSYTCIWMILQRWDGAAYITKLHPLHVCTPIVHPLPLNRHLWAFKFQQIPTVVQQFFLLQFHRPSFKLLQQLRRDCVIHLADHRAAKSKDGCKIEMEHMARLWVIYRDTQ